MCSDTPDTEDTREGTVVPLHRRARAPAFHRVPSERSNPFQPTGVRWGRGVAATLGRARVGLEGRTLAPVNPTGCPRCVAERRARWVRVAANVVATAAVAVVPKPLFIAWQMAIGLLAYGPRNYTVPRALRAQDDAVVWAMIVLALACLAVCTHALAHHHGRHATYREAPVECSRHPFAR